MGATGISFFYDEEKVKILQEEAKADDRTTSSYIQQIFAEHIKEANGVQNPVQMKKRVIKKRRIKRHG